MDKTRKNILRERSRLLVGNLQLSIDILVALYEKKILDEEHMEQIKAQLTNAEKVYLLLKVLPKRGPRAFDDFVAVLEESHPWLAQTLKQDCEEKTSKEVPDASPEPPTVVDKTSDPPQSQRPESEASTEESMDPLEKYLKSRNMCRKCREREHEAQVQMYQLYDMVHWHTDTRGQGQDRGQTKLQLNDMTWEVMKSEVKRLLERITELSGQIESSISHFPRRVRTEARGLEELVRSALEDLETLAQHNRDLQFQLRQDATTEFSKQLTAAHKRAEALKVKNTTLWCEKEKLKEENVRLSAMVKALENTKYQRDRTIDDLKKKVQTLTENASIARHQRTFMMAGGPFVHCDHISSPFADHQHGPNAPDHQHGPNPADSMADASPSQAPTKKAYVSPYRYRKAKKTKRKSAA